MRFPLSLTTTMVGYIAKKKVTRTRRFPLVLMLEPLHACNLTCTGCGRIREYSQTIKEKLTVEECLRSVDEAGAPIVSICGGEPMIYPEIGAPASSTEARHSATLSFSLIVCEYSRMRPQPVQVRLQACSGSSISTRGKRFAPDSFFRAR